jgi:hypothetical protein
VETATRHDTAQRRPESREPVPGLGSRPASAAGVLSREEAREVTREVTGAARERDAGDEEEELQIPPFLR